MEIFAIAVRNILRNPRRTFLNVVAITVGIMIMVVAVGFIRGFAGTIYASMIDLDTAHAQVLNKDYQDQKRIMPLTLSVDDPEGVKTKLRSLPQVMAAGGRIDFPGEITNGVTGVQLMVRGVEPDAEALLTQIKANIIQGEYLNTDGAGILVGKDLADKLNLKPGSQFFLNAVDKYRTRNQITGTVTGIFSFGYALLDSNMVYVTLPTAQSLLAMDNSVTRVVVRFNAGVDPLMGTEVLKSTLAGYSDLKAYEWKEFAVTMVGTVESRLKTFYVLGMVLGFLIIIGILNSMSMSVEERIREIGTLRAVGVKRSWLRNLFLAEGALIGLLGAVFGAALGIIVELIFDAVGIDVRSALPKDLPVPFPAALRPVFMPLDFLLAAGTGLAVSVLGSWIPALRAAKLSIQEALGSHI